MKNEEQSTRYIPIKNYLIIILIATAIILMTLYIFKWYQIKKYEKVSQSYLIEKNLITNQTNNFDELKEVLNDNQRLLLYISYTNSYKIYNLEKSFDKIFKEYNLNEIFYLFNITNIKKDNSNYKDLINNYLDINVDNYPVIIYYENGEINSYKTINSSKDLEKFIKKIDIEKNSQ